jgi:hypothetical protein
MGLVAMLIIDVHDLVRNGPQVRHRAPLASDARFSSRHCKGAPATPFFALPMASITTSPSNCSAPVEYWQNKPKLSIVRLSIEIWWCCVKRTVAIAQKRSNTLLSSQRYATTNSTAILDLTASAVRAILF